MEGAVWVDSELGKGSCFGFRVTLPASDDAATPHLPIAFRRVLVVDDQFINRTILERQLEPCGVAVKLCRNGVEALEALAADGAFDAVLTDHNMPEMDGLTLALRIRERGLDLPIVLLTSDPAAAREAEGYDLMAAVIQKPILRSDLYRQLNALSGAPVEEEVVIEEPPAPPAELRQMRVLTAEDNRTNQLVFQKMVKDVDIELVFANNGLEAVELYQSYRPDLIFMDISMPELDGRDAAPAIRKLEAGRSHVPIVALTAHAMEGDAEGILAAGIDRYMTKPLRKAAIAGVLAEFCPPEARSLEFEAEQMTGT